MSDATNIRKYLHLFENKEKILENNSHGNSILERIIDELRDYSIGFPGGEGEILAAIRSLQGIIKNSNVPTETPEPRIGDNVDDEAESNESGNIVSINGDTVVVDFSTETSTGISKIHKPKLVSYNIRVFRNKRAAYYQEKDRTWSINHY